MRIDFYMTDIGVVVRDNESIRLKSTYAKRVLTEAEFHASNPKTIRKNEYLRLLNKWFRENKHEWTHAGTRFRTLDNFTDHSEIQRMPLHEVDIFGGAFVVMYHGRLYYTFNSGNYFPQMQLIDFSTKQLTGKWTNFKNLAPVFNCDSKQII